MTHRALAALGRQGYLHCTKCGYATCTTAGDNVRQHRVLEGLGWERKDEFKNSATGSTTILWGWKVQPIKEPA